MEKTEKKYCKVCERETTWIMKKNLDGLEKWACETCGYGHIKEKDASDEKQFAFSSFWASVDTLLSDSQKGDISWNNKAAELQIEEDIEECKDRYKDDALFNILLAAHLTQGFKKYPKDRIYVKTLYKHAKANAGKHQERDTVNKLVELYEEYAKGLRMRAVKKAVGAFAAAAVAVAACFVVLILYTPNIQDRAEALSVSIPNDAISVFDKLFAKVSVEKASSGSSAYVDAKEALRNESEKFELYDISLTSHNKELKLDGSVTVTLPIPDGYDESALTVYYVASANSYEEIPKSDISISNGEVSFKTTHFSYYAIAERHPIVIFDTNGADEIPHQTVKRDTAATKPVDPIKEGYTFAGWKKDGKAWDFSADYVRSDMTLVAEWVANEYNVTLIANGVELENTVVSVTYSEAYAELPTELSKPGYAFVGWYTKESGGSLVTRESVMLTASDVTLYARFSENTNKLEFDPNGGEGEMLAIELSTGASQKLPAASFSKLGHTFVGWSTTLSGEVEYIDKAEYTMGTNSSYTLYAVWQVDTNILKFDGNGADSGEMSAEEHLWGSVFNLTLNSFGKAGYSFNGWALRPDGEAVFHNGDEYTMGDRETYTLYACWKPNVNTVKFDSAGGSGSMKNQSITYGEGAYLSKNEFTLEGYDFLGWSDTPDGSVKYIDGGWYYIGTDAEYTLYAVWGARENQIFFMPNGGTGTMENILKIPTDGEGELPQNPFMRTGYTFFAWCTTSDGTGKCYDEGELYNMTTADDVTLYAIWKPVVHRISYVTNSLSELPCDEYTIESGLELPKATELQKEYYTFAGWYANADFDGEAITVIESGTLGADTYYAKWTPILFPITYVTNGGTVIEKDYYTVEDNYPLKDKDDTSKTGYDFAGWYETSELAGEAVTSIEKGSTGAKVYYAKWEIITYYIYFDTGFETKLESITYNIESETFELPEFEDERLGYTFRGWYNNPSNHGTAISYIAKGSHGSMRLYADWSTNEYDIIYVTNGGEYIASEKYTVLDKIRLTTPVRDGYTFLGWYTDEDFGGDAITAIGKGSVEDVTLYAAWELIEYTLTLHSTSGDITKTFTVETPSFNITDKDIKNCYDFNYWQYIDGTPCYTIPQGTCENIQLYPNHTPTDYIISFDTHGGNTVSDKYYNVETESFTLPIPMRSGYTFLGWYIDVSYSGLAVSSISKGTNGSFTLHAKWDINEYIVNTETNGGNDLGSLTYTVESGILSLPKAEKSGYDFIGWHLRSDLSDEIITQIPTGTMGHMTLYAEWEIITYTVDTNMNGGNDVDDITYTVETQTFDLPIPTYVTYPEYNHFLGWYDNPDFLGEPIASVPKGSIGDKTYYAKWDLCTVYDSIDSTPFAISANRVIVDWRNESDTNLLNHTARVVQDTRYNSIYICDGTNEIIFIGSPDKTYTNFRMYLCYYDVGDKVKLRFVDFNFTSNESTAISPYQDAGVSIEVVVEGSCSIGTSFAGGNIFHISENNLTITGSGTLTLTAGKGSDGSSAGASGAVGGVAIYANTLIIDMDGEIFVVGGDGGNGSEGQTGYATSHGGDGGNGGDGGMAINCQNVSVINSNAKVHIIGGNGGNGGKGGKITDGSNNDGMYDMADAGNGGNGGNGGKPILISSLDNLYCSSLELKYGNGGNGGDGGDGGNPSVLSNDYKPDQKSAGGDGGNGGNGFVAGNGGKGGSGGGAYGTDTWNHLPWIGVSGDGGDGGDGGNVIFGVIYTSDGAQLLETDEDCGNGGRYGSCGPILDPGEENTGSYGVDGDDGFDGTTDSSYYNEFEEWLNN